MLFRSSFSYDLARTENTFLLRSTRPVLNMLDKLGCHCFLLVFWGCGEGGGGEMGGGGMKRELCSHPAQTWVLLRSFSRHLPLAFLLPSLYSMTVFLPRPLIHYCSLSHSHTQTPSCAPEQTESIDHSSLCTSFFTSQTTVFLPPDLTSPCRLMLQYRFIVHFKVWHFVFPYALCISQPYQ